MTGSRMQQQLDAGISSGYLSTTTQFGADTSSLNDPTNAFAVSQQQQQQPSNVPSAESNLFSNAAAPAPARIQLSQSTYVPMAPVANGGTPRRKAPTQSQQRHLQHQHAAGPYAMMSAQQQQPHKQQQQAVAAVGLPVGVDDPPAPTQAALSQTALSLDRAPMAVAQYRMSRDINTVPDLWQEWDRGLNGGPIVRELEEKYGTRWRQNSAERKFFCLRKVIIDYVMRLYEHEGLSIEEAVNRTEDIRKTHQYTSLQRLAEHLKKVR
ncbi:transcriptional activator of glycolytic enzymes-domain-containing protein [Limtongia smithiae]|uniref:transcriptional activator of glycolytic enzymes-domain-containing protein n=1 Tax=Limtongia smithiae TaxID=1125753 RepID=UPI0034CE5CE4